MAKTPVEAAAGGTPAQPPHPSLASLGRSRTFVIEKEGPNSVPGQDAEELADAAPPPSSAPLPQPAPRGRGQGGAQESAQGGAGPAVPVPAPRRQRASASQSQLGDSEQAPPSSPGEAPGDAIATPSRSPSDSAATSTATSPTSRASTGRKGTLKRSHALSRDEVPPAAAPDPRAAEATPAQRRRRLLRRQQADDSSSSDSAGAARPRGRVLLVTEAEVHPPPSAGPARTPRRRSSTPRVADAVGQPDDSGVAPSGQAPPPSAPPAADGGGLEGDAQAPGSSKSLQDECAVAVVSDGEVTPAAGPPALELDVDAPRQGSSGRPGGSPDHSADGDLADRTPSTLDEAGSSVAERPAVEPGDVDDDDVVLAEDGDEPSRLAQTEAARPEDTEADVAQDIIGVGLAVDAAPLDSDTRTEGQGSPPPPGPLGATVVPSAVPSPTAAQPGQDVDPTIRQPLATEEPSGTGQRDDGGDEGATVKPEVGPEARTVQSGSGQEAVDDGELPPSDPGPTPARADGVATASASTPAGATAQAEAETETQDGATLAQEAVAAAASVDPKAEIKADAIEEETEAGSPAEVESDAASTEAGLKVEPERDANTDANTKVKVEMEAEAPRGPEDKSEAGAEARAEARTTRLLHELDEATRARLQQRVARMLQESCVESGLRSPDGDGKELHCELEASSAALTAFYATPDANAVLADQLRRQSADLLRRVRELRGEVAAQWPDADAASRACRTAHAAHCHGRGLGHGLAGLLLMAALPGQRLH